jgi:hypothetical protein
MARKPFEKTAYRSLSDDHLECRDLRHSWKTHQGFSVEQKKVRGRRMTVYNRILLCTRCGLLRTDYFDRNLDRVAIHYDYPDGYQVARGMDGSRGARAIRIEIVTREVAS